MAPPWSRPPPAKVNTDEEETTVDVNKEALVNILTRYPGAFDVFRELIQNADDAEAQTVEIHFETGKSLPANVDLNTVKVCKWVIKNDGKPLEDEDWGRLGKIAEGNRNSSKVGAFGVGFYIVLSVCDKPLVKSNGKFLRMSRGKELRVNRGSSETHAPDGMTSIELDLKSDVKEPLPKLVDLSRFLISSITFLDKIRTISVFLDNWRLLCIQKEREVLSSIDNFENTSGTLAIRSIDYAIQHVMVNAVEQAFPKPKELSADEADGVDEHVTSSPQEAQTSDAPLPPGLCNMEKERTLDIAYDLYTAQVHASPSLEMKNGVQSVMKALPEQFPCKVVYFNSKQHNTVVDSELSHLFWGSDGILQDNNGRIFIGQSTRQNTGIGLHIGSYFLPTVERGTVDLTNGQVALWNEAVFKVAGCLARVVYEQEMEKAEKAETDGNAIGLFTMKRFAFEGQADNEVLQYLKDGFFISARNLRVLTTRGISSVAKVRKRNALLSSLQSHRFLSDDLSQRHRALLNDRCQITTVSLQDLADEFTDGVSETQVLAFFSWWRTSQMKFRRKEGFVEQLRSKGRLRMNGEDIVVNKVQRYTLVTAEKDLLPPGTLYIPALLEPVLDQLGLFGWTPFETLDWLAYCAELLRNRGAAPHEMIGYHVFIALTGPRGISCLSQQDRDQAKKLLESVECVRTDKGLKKPSEAYFTISGVFEDLPAVDDKGLSREVRQALEHIGVRRQVDWNRLLPGLEENANAGTNDHLLRYLAGVEDKKTLNSYIKDLKKWRVFASEKHGRLLSTGLYRPDVLDGKLRELGLPILDMPPGGSIDADLEDVLKQLGMRKYPLLQEIVAWLSTQTTEEVFKVIARECLWENKAEYHTEAMASSEVFVPTVAAEKLVTTRLVVRSSNWEKLGFSLISNSLRDEDVLLEVLGIEEDPPATVLIGWLKNNHLNMEQARPLLEQLASHRDRDDLRQLRDIAFVPIQVDSTHTAARVKYKCPRDCFVISSDPASNPLGRVFPIVNFGERGNQFLLFCGAKNRLPEASDIAREMVNDPVYYLWQLGEDWNRYLDDLRDIAAKFDTFHEDIQEDMREQPMLLAIRTGEGSPNEYELRLATNILIGEDKENLVDFGTFAFMAPEGLETLYEKLGSKHLDDYVEYNIDPCCTAYPSDPPFSQDDILRCAECFMSDELADGRQPAISIDDLRGKHNFQMKLCDKLKLFKKFVPPLYHLEEDISQVEGPTRSVAAFFEHESRDDSYTLWIAENHESDLTTDVARALCCILRMNRRQDLMRMELFLRDTGSLMAYDERKTVAVEDLPGTSNPYKLPRSHEEPLDVDEKQTDDGHLDDLLPLPASLHAKGQNWKHKHKSMWGSLKAKLDIHVDFDPIQCAKEAICPKESSSEKPSRQCDANTLKEDTRCKRVKARPDLKPEDSLGRHGLRFFWTGCTRYRILDSEELKALDKFAKIVYNLAQIFQVDHSATFSIIWKDKDEDLMGFNRDQEHIYLNLAYYFKHYYKVNSKEQREVADWYFILAHEIAHNKSLEHDKIHEMTFAGLCVRHLNALFKYYPSCEEYLQTEVVSVASTHERQ